MAEKNVTVEQVNKMITEATSGIGKLIAEAVKGMVPADQLQTILTEATKGLITENQVRELIAEAQQDMFDHVNAATLETITGDQVSQEQPLDPEWLEGLEFRGATQAKNLVEGRTRLTGKPFIRPLEPGDVLSHRIDGDQVTIVTKDGRKHTVEI